MIPPGAAVVCSRNLGGHLGTRPAVWVKLRRLDDGRAIRPTWIMLDLEVGAVEGYSRAMRYLREVESFLAEYECVARESNFVLLRRGDTSRAGPRFEFTSQEAEAYWRASWTRARGTHEAYPHEPAPLIAAALLLAESRMFPQAIELLTRGIPKAKQSPYLFVLLGICQDSSGHRDKARRAWREALRLDPGNRQAQALLLRTNGAAVERSAVQPRPRLRQSPRGRPLVCSFARERLMMNPGKDGDGRSSSVPICPRKKRSRNHARRALGGWAGNMLRSALCHDTADRAAPPRLSLAGNALERRQGGPSCTRMAVPRGTLSMPRQGAALRCWCLRSLRPCIWSAPVGSPSASTAPSPT